MGWIADADLQALLLPDHTLPAPALAAYTTGITYGTARCTLYLYCCTVAVFTLKETIPTDFPHLLPVFTQSRQ